MSENMSSLLVVEDDLDVAEMLNAYFRIQGYDVNVVNWGEDALPSCLSHQPDLVILDIRLPDINGYEVAQRLRANRRTRDIPIIFLTDKRAREDRLRGLSLGADDYVTKPFDVQELRLRVRNAIKRANQGGLRNPVTGLPEGAVLDEKFAELLKTTDWSVLSIEILNLDEFRDAYGFVASDDVLRAISLMVTNTLRDHGTPEDFCGQLAQNQLVVITRPEVFPTLSTRILGRLEQSLDYFYPLKDRASQKPASGKRLGIALKEVHANQGPFEGLEGLRSILLG